DILPQDIRGCRPPKTSGLAASAMSASPRLPRDVRPEIPRPSPRSLSNTSDQNPARTRQPGRRPCEVLDDRPRP
ncbi:hypothetical protein PIB30_107124, partial [Stylosanthes scabra]|nr:hypothetical protein [Stylosanthes scabra]